MVISHMQEAAYQVRNGLKGAEPKRLVSDRMN